MIDITVCILSYNRAKYLSEAIASVLCQDITPNEIIIYDNGSKGDVYEAASAFFSKGVRWVGSEITHSPFWNFRRAVNETKTKYVFVMHDDDKICRDFLEKQISFLEGNPNVDAVTCNGYLIDVNGKRNGRVLREDFINQETEYYKCSVDVAIRYASDSCIPFAPVVYRSELVRKVDFRAEYEKFADAVFFCDIADIGVLTFRSDLLYECRVHAGQDSNFFPIDLSEKLQTFFETRKSNNPDDKIRLHNLLVRQHTARTIKYLLNSKNVAFEFKRLSHNMFSFFTALDLALSVVKKKFFKKTLN